MARSLNNSRCRVSIVSLLKVMAKMDLAWTLGFTDPGNPDVIVSGVPNLFGFLFSTRVSNLTIA